MIHLLAFAPPVNFVEVSGGGIQAVTNNQKYVTISRLAPTSPSEVLMRVEGGYAQFDRADEADRSLLVSGKADFTSSVNIGSNSSVNDHWNGLTTKMFAIETANVGQGTSSTSAPLNLGSEIRSQGATLYLAPSSTNKEYALPYKTSSTTKPDADSIPDGAIVTITNVSSSNSAQIQGTWNTTYGFTNAYTLAAKKSITLQYYANQPLYWGSSFPVI